MTKIAPRHDNPQAAFVNGPWLRARPVDDVELQKCQELLGYHFNDPDMLALALTHASVAPTRLESNERLEFLGDAVLGMVVCHWLYANQIDLLEGEMTKIKSLVVSRQTCATIAEEAAFSPLLSLGKGMTGAGALPRSVSAAVFEAIIGAIFLTAGWFQPRRGRGIIPYRFREGK